MYQQTHYLAIQSWDDMRNNDCQFESPNYKQQDHLQFTHLVQGSYFIEDTANKLYSLAIRSKFPWNEDVMISMYHQEINSDISSSLVTGGVSTMADAIQVAYQLEYDSKKKALCPK